MRKQSCYHAADTTTRSPNTSTFALPFCNVHPSRFFKNINGEQEDKKTIQSVDMSSLIATELNKLSFKEREEVYEDLHAISKQKGKTKEEIEALISQVKENISLSRRNKQAYNKAFFLIQNTLNPTNFFTCFWLLKSFIP